MQELKHKPFIFDGAMGTYYAMIADNPVSPCELANLQDHDTIIKIHYQYISAGCHAIKTNTFAANQVSLACDFESVREVIHKGYALASEAARGTEVEVFADIGPIPVDDTSDLEKEYRQIVDVFLELGAVNFLFETFNSGEHLAALTKYIKSRNPEAYAIVSFAVSPEGLTRLGESGHQLIDDMLQVPTIDACGFNCFSGPLHLREYMQTFAIEGRTFSVMPNSGYPTLINNRTFFETTKEYFADQMLQIARQGVTILGGCCGTTPEYIRAMVNRLHSWTGDHTKPGPLIEKPQYKNPIRNLLTENMAQGQKIIAVELDPPFDTDIQFFMDSARLLQAAGVDAITIADNPLARARVDSSLMACKLKRELDMTPIPHLTCRDRNINATKALLLGLNIEGINNILVVTGDPVPTAQRDEIKGIFSFNSAVLAKYITNLNETVFGSPFNIGAALNVNVRHFDNQLQRAQKKIASGVNMFLTQPVLSPAAVENIITARRELEARILGGIMPIVSYKNACFMNNEIAGITVDDEIVEMYRDLSKEDAAKLAVDLSVQMAARIAPYVDGYYLITPFKRIDIILEIIKGIRNVP